MPTPKLTQKGHFVHEHDRERIRCIDCGGRAFVCTYAPDGGAPYFYYCGPCAEGRDIINFEEPPHANR